MQALLSFYDALILVGHSSHQPYADRLNQWLKQYGYTAWQPATLPPSHAPNTIDAVVSHAHNVLLVATPTVYPNDVRAMIEQAMAYHKRLFVIVPLVPEEDGLDATDEADSETLTDATHSDRANSDRIANFDGTSSDGINPDLSSDDLAGADLANADPTHFALTSQDFTTLDRDLLDRDPMEALSALADLMEWESHRQTNPWLVQMAVQVEGDVPSTSLLQLIETLQDQAELIHQHSRLLVRALQWSSHDYAAQHWLTESDLTQAIQWLNAITQASGPTCQPTALQQDFIIASTQSTDDAIVTVLLAYADGDREIPLSPGGPASLDALRDLLQAAGISMWDLHNDCPPEANLEIALSRATEACDNYVILLSPHALGHALCLEGLLFALSMNKRIVPVLLSTVDADHLPEPLQGMPWVDLRGAKPPLSTTNAGRQLIQALRHEADYHRTHTQLLMAALRWERQQRHPNGLLSPQEARTYHRWIQEAQQRSRHRPIYLQELFITESLRRTTLPTHSDSPRQILAQMTDHMKTWLAQRIHR